MHTLLTKMNRNEHMFRGTGDKQGAAVKQNCSWDKQPSGQVSFLDFFSQSPVNRRCFRKGWVVIPHRGSIRYQEIPHSRAHFMD